MLKKGYNLQVITVYVLGSWSHDSTVSLHVSSLASKERKHQTLALLMCTTQPLKCYDYKNVLPYPALFNISVCKCQKIHKRVWKDKKKHLKLKLKQITPLGIWRDYSFSKVLAIKAWHPEVRSSAAIRVGHGVYVNFCQLDTKLDIARKRESQLRTFIHQSSLWVCLWGILFIANCYRWTNPSMNVASVV